MARTQERKRNRLLAALTDAEWGRWGLRLEHVALARGEVLYEPGRPRSHAYFPISAIVSLLCPVAGGAATEIAVVGNEGVVDISLLLGADSTRNGSAVLIPGQAFRIGAQAIQDELGRSDAVRRLLLCYVQALATQIAQTAICNRLHSVEQQLCGWLLHHLDRLRGSEVAVTQEVIASLLGVRRESVTKAAGQLREAGLIHNSRGHIAVLDRAGLEQRSCECHAVVKKEYDRLLPIEPAARPAGAGRWTWAARQEAEPGHRTLLHEAMATGST